VQQVKRQQPLQLHVLIAMQTQHQKQDRKLVLLIAMQAIKKLALHAFHVMQALRQHLLQLHVQLAQQEKYHQQQQRLVLIIALQAKKQMVPNVLIVH